MCCRLCCVKIHTAKATDAPSVPLWGTGTPKREFLHVDDLAAGCVHLMDTHDSSDWVNIGTGEDLSIRELAEMICSIVGYEGTLDWDASKPDGTPRKLMDVKSNACSRVEGNHRIARRH